MEKLISFFNIRKKYFDLEPMNMRQDTESMCKPTFKVWVLLTPKKVATLIAKEFGEYRIKKILKNK